MNPTNSAQELPPSLFDDYKTLTNIINRSAEELGKAIEACKAESPETWEHLNQTDILLRFATYKNNIQAAKILIEHGARMKSSTLAHAINCGNMEMMNLLKDSNCPIGDDVFLVGVRKRNNAVFKWLGGLSAKPQTDAPIVEAILTGQQQFLEEMIERGYHYEERTVITAYEIGEYNTFEYLKRRMVINHKQLYDMAIHQEDSGLFFLLFPSEDLEKDKERFECAFNILKEFGFFTK
jgi:hypothetical protein